MTENAVQLGYVSKGVIYSQTLPYVLPCISVWHDHLSVLIISLPLLMQRDFGYHWYCGGAVPPRDPDSHVQMKVFICEHKYSFFLPRLLAAEDKHFWPQRKEEENLGGNKFFKASASWIALTKQLSAVAGQNSVQGWICLGSPLQPQ